MGNMLPGKGPGLPLSLVLLPCLPFGAGAPACMITSYGGDGVGHRVSSDISCIAVAHELGLRYVVKPWDRLEHVQTGDIKPLQEYFKFYADFPTMTDEMHGVGRQPLPWVGKCEEIGWLDAVAKNWTRCKADGQTVYQADNCWDRFWCTTIFSRDLQSVMSRIRGAFLPSLPAVPRMAPHVIHVALHVRTGDVGLRGLPVRWYFVVAAKIADRHDRYVRVSGSKLGLKFWIHTDFPRLRAAAMPKLGRHEVEVVAAKEHSLQDCLTQMVKADLLVASISSFSDVVGLLGGMMVVYPRCHSEHQPLPGWHVVSCDANPNLDRMCWPPTRFSAEGRRKRMEVGGCTAREPSSRNRTRWTFVDLPKFKPRLEEQIFGGMPLSPQQAQQEGSSVIKTFKKSLQTYPVTILGLWLALNVMVAIRVVSYAQKRYG